MKINGSGQNKLSGVFVANFSSLVKWFGRKVVVHKIKAFFLLKKPMKASTTKMQTTDIRRASKIEFNPFPSFSYKATWPVKSSQQEVKS